LERREKQCHAAPSAAPVAPGFSCQCTHAQLCSARTQLKCLCSTTIRPLVRTSLSARDPLPSAFSIAQHRPALDHDFISKPPGALFFSSTPDAYCPNLNLDTTHGWELKHQSSVSQHRLWGILWRQTSFSRGARLARAPTCRSELCLLACTLHSPS
jgi:hypothetical protein